MNILWICNKETRLVSEILNYKTSNLGGWLDSMCNDIVLDKSNKLCVMFLSDSIVDGVKENFEFHSYFENSIDTRLFEVLTSFKPDLIHIWGTEFKHTYDAINVIEKNNLINKCVISIQGLVSIYGQYHYVDGIPNSWLRPRSFRDIIKLDSINKGKKDFIFRGEFEIEAIKKCKHIIGRTDFDKAVVYQINPYVNYHFCNETLRENFYSFDWNISNVERNSIFVSQANYPIKGFHYMLEALSIIKKIYPDVILYTTCKDLINLNFNSIIRLNSYQLYIRKLIFKYGLQTNVKFLGGLTAEEMKDRFVKSHVFVSPSTIENSSNSVGEAMILGCPVVSSDVGGIKNLLTHSEEGFIYHASAPYMLAHYVMEIFKNDNLAIKFSTNAHNHAIKTHCRKTNFNQLMNIYLNIINN